MRGAERLLLLVVMPMLGLALQAIWRVRRPPPPAIRVDALHLRRMALAITADDLAPGDAADPGPVHGVVVDWPLGGQVVDSPLGGRVVDLPPSGRVVDSPLGGQVVTLVALADGHASLYASGGGGILGAGADADVAAAARRCVHAARALAAAATPVVDCPLPPAGELAVPLLGAGGTRVLRVPLQAVEGDGHPLAPLWAACQDLRSALLGASLSAGMAR